MISIVLFFAAILFLPACNNQSILYFESDNYYFAREDESITEDLSLTEADAEPLTAEVRINNEITTMLGYAIDGVARFRLQEIERILWGTRAQFRFEEPSQHSISYWIYRFSVSEPYIHLTTPDYEINRAYAQANIVQVWVYTPFPYRDGASNSMYAYRINEHHYFTLYCFGAVLGFTTGQTDGEIWINTHEAYISAHGRQAAVQFLSQFPTLFYREWSEETLETTPYIRPWGYFAEYELWTRFYPVWFYMYDFSGNGVPDFLIGYDTIGWVMRPTMHLFMYIDGIYQEVTTISPWGGIFADFEGSIFTIEGTHQEGYTHAQKISFVDGCPVVEIFIEPFWWVWEYEEDFWGTQRDNEWAEHWELWESWNFFVPTIPGVPDEPLIAVRPIPDLDMLREVLEILIAEGRIPE